VTRLRCGVRVRELGRVVTVLAALAGGPACGGADGDGGVRALSCEDGGVALAAAREPDTGHGIPQVVVASGSDEGGGEVVTGDWVATSPALAPDGRWLVSRRGPATADQTYRRTGTTCPSPVSSTAPGCAGRWPAYRPRAASPRISRLCSTGWWSRRPLGRRTGRRWPTSPARSTTAQIAPGACGSCPPAEATRATWLDWRGNGIALVGTLGAGDGTIAQVDVATGRVERLADYATMPAVSPDGERLYYAAREPAPPSPQVSGEPVQWRLSVARLTNDGLRHDRPVADVVHPFLYPYLGLSTGPCA
jgi:hypothetical protein